MNPDEFHFGVTGTRAGPSLEQAMALGHFMNQVAFEFMSNRRNPKIVLHHGDCTGVDIFVAERFKSFFGAEIVCHPPTDSKHRGFYPSDVSLPAKPYLQRDKEIVQKSEFLIAIPLQWEEVVRSGTWATIRYARKLVKPHMIIRPDGTVFNSQRPPVGRL